MRDEPGPSTLQAVDRALRLLMGLADSSRSRTLVELSGLARCSPSTVHRMLAALSRYRLVEKDPQTRRYRLGLGVLYLADARLQHLDLRTAARLHMERLRDWSKETVSVYTVQGFDLVCIDRIDSPEEVRRTVQVGRSIPLPELGATAKAVLAHLPHEQREKVLAGVDWQRAGRTRADVLAELDDIGSGRAARSFCERIPGASAMAAPIPDHWKQVGGVLTISGPHTRWIADQMDRWEAALLEAARAISRELGYAVQGTNGREPDGMQAGIARSTTAADTLGDQGGE